MDDDVDIANHDDLNLKNEDVEEDSCTVDCIPEEQPCHACRSNPHLDQISSVSGGPWLAFNHLKTRRCSAPDSLPGDVVIERKGTMLGGIINVGMTALGIGTLGFAQSFYIAGWLTSGILLVFCAVISDLSSWVLVRVASRTNQFSYAGLAEHYFGFWGVRVCNMLLAITLFFMAVATFRIPMMTVTTLIRNAVVEKDDTTTYGFILNPDHGWIVGIVVFVLIAMPAYVKSMSTLETLSGASFFFMIVAFVLFLILSIADISTQSAPTNIKATTDWSSTFFFFGTASVAFMCQYNVLQVLAEMEIQKNIDKVIHISILGISLPLYAIIGYLGYICIGEGVDKKGPKNNVFDSLGDSSVAAGVAWRKYLALIAQICVVLMVIGKAPLVVNPLRDVVIFEISQIQRFMHWSVHRVSARFGVAIFLMIIVYFTAIFMNLKIILGFTGALICTLLNFFIPGIFFMADAEMYETGALLDQETSTKMNVFCPRWRQYSKAGKFRYCTGLFLVITAVVLLILGLWGLIVVAIIGKK